MLNWGWKPKDWQGLSVRERGLVIAGIDIEQERQQREIDAMKARDN